MIKVDFDEYACHYDSTLRRQLRFFEEETDYFAEYKIRAIKRIIQGVPGRILEYGCGTGRNLVFLIKLFPGAGVTACDISKKSLEIAAVNNPTVKTFLLTEKIAARDRFDLIVAANVFHHISPEQRMEHMSRLYSWLEPGGRLYLFEQNPFNPVTRYLVKTCAFDKDAVLLTPGETLSLMSGAGFTSLKRRYMLFFPSFLKKFRILEPSLENLPFGGQYSIEAVKR